MIERRLRMNGWFGTEEVPAVRFEAKDVPPEEAVRLTVTTEVAFKGLELVIEEGDAGFDICALSVDGVNQLTGNGALGAPVPAHLVNDDPHLVFPFSKDGGELEMVVVNRSYGGPATFRAFVLGRVKNPVETRETVQP